MQVSIDWSTKIASILKLRGAQTINTIQMHIFTFFSIAKILRKIRENVKFLRNSKFSFKIIKNCQILPKIINFSLIFKKFFETFSGVRGLRPRELYAATSLISLPLVDLDPLPKNLQWALMQYRKWIPSRFNIFLTRKTVFYKILKHWKVLHKAKKFYKNL